MTDQPVSIIPGPTQVAAIPARLEPNAIGVAQDTIIGLASSAPAATMAATLATLAATAAYGGGAVVLLCAVPMLILANCYRRLNLWNANCGASFEWVGRAISPYLGFMVGWLMLAGCLIGTSSVVVVLSPAILAIFGDSASSTWPNIFICTAVTLVMLTIAVVGIRITARTQVAVAAVEYAVLLGVSIWGLVYVIGHHHGTFPITRDWLSVSGIGGKGSLASGLLIAVFMFSGWDATVYVNEEVKHRRVNPGRAAVFAVALLVIMYALPQVGLQGVVSPARLQANSSDILVYIAQVLGGSVWAKVMAFALALSVIASTNTGIVITARIAYGMASHRTLPPVLGQVEPALLHPGHRQHHRRRDPHRHHLGLPAVRLDRQRVQQPGRCDRPALRHLLHAHGPGGHHLLPAPHPQQRLGRGTGRHPAAGRGGLPGLGRREVAAERARVAAVVGDRHRGRRPGPDGLRPLRPAVPVLPHRAGERAQERGLSEGR